MIWIFENSILLGKNKYKNYERPDVFTEIWKIMQMKYKAAYNIGKI